jgi:hypothetical protein
VAAAWLADGAAAAPHACDPAVIMTPLRCAAEPPLPACLGPQFDAAEGEGNFLGWAARDTSGKLAPFK